MFISVVPIIGRRFPSQYEVERVAHPPMAVLVSSFIDSQSKWF
jgi:hypothetical protein